MPIKLTISVEQVSEPIRGTVATMDGAVERPFRGWLDLAASLEALLQSQLQEAAAAADEA